MPAYLVQRGRKYHLRLRVPADLTYLFGRRELHRSLRVTDPRLARSIASALRAQAEAAFATIRHRQALGDDQPSLLQLARSIYAEKMPSTWREQHRQPSRAMMQRGLRTFLRRAIF